MDLLIAFVSICFLDCLSRLGQAPLLLSAVGKDEHLESVLHYCHHMVCCTEVAPQEHGRDDITQGKFFPTLAHFRATFHQAKSRNNSMLFLDTDN